ncbi:XapX domain-containing protein [Campylobacter pinnipediorum]|uniref:XapX domain-containing protein n=1 Tax=Campylobacter pinnipediorum TaxID=1965231 RepID=UPI00084D9CB6|nr:XapX domain-containing protein [Campylobacter pinnipediorum]
MKLYFFSLCVGLLVGVIYYILNVRSPAPPLVALIGLLGMLIGEQIIPVVKNFFSKDEIIKTNEETNIPKKTNNQYIIDTQRDKNDKTDS